MLSVVWKPDPGPLRSAILTEAVIDRFWSRVERRGPTECWPWLERPIVEFGIGPLVPATSYGRMSVKGRLWPAHRVSYLIAHGELDARLPVDHTCVNPSCVNPAHLRQVTAAVNSQSQVRRSAHGRNVYAVRNGFAVRVKRLGKIHWGGQYATAEDARCAAERLRLRLFDPEYEDRP